MCTSETSINLYQITYKNASCSAVFLCNKDGLIVMLLNDTFQTTQSTECGRKEAAVAYLKSLERLSKTTIKAGCQIRTKYFRNIMYLDKYKETDLN
jgi:hypothetical protein